MHRHLSFLAVLMQKQLKLVLFAFVFSIFALRNAQAVHYDNFADTSALTLNGYAITVGSGVNAELRLAYDGGTYGSVFINDSLGINTFSTHFDFQITDSGGVVDSNGLSGGDGFTFCIQSLGPNAVGAGGNALGLGGSISPPIPNILPSVAVEFDTYRNNSDLLDPDSNHIGIDLNGDVSHATGLPTVYVSTPFDDGNIWHGWIDYNGITLEVRASQSSDRPLNPLLSYAIDIPAVLGSNSAFVGFTGGTASAYGNYDILNWDIQSVPEPSTLVLLGIGAIGFVGFACRRRKLVK